MIEPPAYFLRISDEVLTLLQGAMISKMTLKLRRGNTSDYKLFFPHFLFI
jgi:hypothetical protein